jgi:hypothetical protein
VRGGFDERGLDGTERRLIEVQLRINDCTANGVPVLNLTSKYSRVLVWLLVARCDEVRRVTSSVEGAFDDDFGGREPKLVRRF